MRVTLNFLHWTWAFKPPIGCHPHLLAAHSIAGTRIIFPGPESRAWRRADQDVDVVRVHPGHTFSDFMCARIPQWFHKTGLFSLWSWARNSSRKMSPAKWARSDFQRVFCTCWPNSIEKNVRTQATCCKPNTIMPPPNQQRSNAQNATTARSVSGPLASFLIHVQSIQCVKFTSATSG